MLRPDESFIKLLKQSASTNRAESTVAMEGIAKALETPLRQGILNGDITNGIFQRMVIDPGTSTEWPLDLLSPGDEADFVAYVNPGHGRIPERAVESDYVMIPTYGIAGAIDWLLRYAREANWDVVRRAGEVLEAQFVRKINNDAWHTLLSAAVDRNILVYDADAAAGQFTKRLVSLMKVVMRRNAGGNAGSLRRGRLTDLYLSPEGLEEVRNWGVDQLDEVSRREVYVSTDGSATMTRVFGINLHDLDELGENQEFQDYYENDLSGTYGPASDVELVVGLDLQSNDSFIMPIKQEVTIFSDDARLHRQQRAGLYGWGEFGFGVLDTRRVLAGSF